MKILLCSNGLLKRLSSSMLNKVFIPEQGVIDAEKSLEGTTNYKSLSTTALNPIGATKIFAFVKHFSINSFQIRLTPRLKVLKKYCTIL